MSCGYSAGNPALRTLSANPSRRKISMVRAATWLHLGSGGTARARVSTTVTLIPRHARSIASVRPTGPAPDINTSDSVISGMNRTFVPEASPRTWFSSFQFDARILDDVSPAVDLGPDVSRETVRPRPGQGILRDRRELVAGCGIGNQLSDLRSQLIDDHPGDTGGRNHALPCD